MSYRYQKAILGGTFDRFHNGHQTLLDTAFAQSEHVIIGISRPAIYKKKLLANNIEEYAIRESTIKEYLVRKNYNKRAKIIPIEDIYGNSLTEKNIQAIFVTEENLPNVQIINNKRDEIGFPLLEVVTVPYIKAEDGEHITSERIRRGEIDRVGHVYAQLFYQRNILVMPDTLRETLREPIGTIVPTTAEVISLLENKLVITVGDIVTKSLKDAGRAPEINIIDFMTRRHKMPLIAHMVKFYTSRGKRVTNKPGTISRAAVSAYLANIENYLVTNEEQTLIIDGEEDLLALPAILLAPLGSIVLYGQFDRGIVVNEVTEEKKKKVENLLKRFE